MMEPQHTKDLEKIFKQINVVEDILSCVRVSAELIHLRVRNSASAKILKSQERLFYPARLAIFVRSKVYSSGIRNPLLMYPDSEHGASMDIASTADTILNGSSRWLMDPRNWALLEQINAPCVIYSADDDHRVRAMRNWLSTRKWNKDPVFLLSDGGQPLGVWDEAIATPRRQLIERAIATGEKQVQGYKYFWKEQNVWCELVHTVIPYGDEVLVIAADADTEYSRWQKEPSYWRNLERSLK